MRKFLFFLIAVLVASCQTTSYEFDIAITGGTIYSGLDENPYQGFIGIKDDSIAYIANRAPKSFISKKTIEADGYVLSPGFIDPHTHAMGDLMDSVRCSNQNYLHQGVTTVFVGSDGRSYSDLEKQFGIWESLGIGTNAITYSGHSTLRRRIMGMRDDAPTDEELEQMKSLLKADMEAGAFGLSSGLYYAPASYATTEEVIELAKVAASYGGNYDVHMRDESSYTIGLKGAVEETISIAEEGGLPGHIAHIKCLGVDVWDTSDDIIEVVEKARARGVQITADQYPYQASGTSITGALVPRWVLADDPDPRPKFKDSNLRKRIEEEMTENLRKRGGPASLLLTRPNEKIKDLLGLNLKEVAEKWNMSAIDAAIEIIIQGGSSVGSFNMKESDIVNYMQQPWVMTGSDGSSGHPRKYGSYPKKIREYVMEKEVLSLKDMIIKSSALPAKTFGISRRGVLKAGNYADIILFKPEEVMDNATFQDPTALAEGMHYVLVNGQIAIEEGKYNGALAGRGLRKR